MKTTGLSTLALLLLSAGLCSAQVTFTTYEEPVPAYLQGITAGPDGNVWYVDKDRSLIARITPAGVITHYPTTTPYSGPTAITLGPGGNLWFTESYVDQIGMIDPTTGVITEYPIPSSTSSPYASPLGIAYGPDGNVWFTEGGRNCIGKMTPAGAVTEFPIATPYSYPLVITVGPDGNLWFTEQYGNNIGRITLEGVITEFPLLVPYSYPVGITAGPDGNLWFCNSAVASIGRITTSGAITTFPLPEYSGPWGITAGPDGNLWFTDSYNLAIGKITTSGQATLYPIPHPLGPPWFIAVGGNGHLWFTMAELEDPGIGQVNTAADQYQLAYASNLNSADAVVNITNTGSQGGTDPAGTICANIYAFDPAEEMIACCSCLVTPNGLRSVSVRNDLVSNTLTPGAPTSITVALVATTLTGNACNASAVALNGSNLVQGARAWATTTHPAPVSGMATTENVFQTVDLSATELFKLQSYCNFIQTNGSSYGICKSCHANGLGAASK